MRLSDLNIFKRLSELENKEIELEDTLTEVRIAFLRLIDLQISKVDEQLTKSKMELDYMHGKLTNNKFIDLDKKIIDLDVM